MIFNLLIPVPFQAYYAIRNDRGHKAIQIINNTLSKTAEKRPDRFLALGTLPMQDGDAAVVKWKEALKISRL